MRPPESGLRAAGTVLFAEAEAVERPDGSVAGLTRCLRRPGRVGAVELAIGDESEALGALVDGEWTEAFVSAPGRIQVPIVNTSAERVELVWRRGPESAARGGFVVPRPIGLTGGVGLRVVTRPGVAVRPSPDLQPITRDELRRRSVAATTHHVQLRVETLDRSREADRLTLVRAMAGVELDLREAARQVGVDAATPDWIAATRRRLNNLVASAGLDGVLEEARRSIGESSSGPSRERRGIALEWPATGILLSGTGQTACYVADDGPGAVVVGLRGRPLSQPSRRPAGDIPWAAATLVLAGLCWLFTPRDG
jgi:hypothetical protein